MLENNRSLYTIGIVAGIIDEHPETLRVWERNGLIKPNREKYQRKYSNNDVKRLKFIKFLLDERKLNIAGVKQVSKMYSCWFRENCNGGFYRGNKVPINKEKPCWKIEGSYCYVIEDKSEICNVCDYCEYNS